MRHVFIQLFGRLRGNPPPADPHPDETQVLVPEAVALPLPKSPGEEISVPASINGRDLSTGRL